MNTHVRYIACNKTLSGFKRKVVVHRQRGRLNIEMDTSNRKKGSY